MKCPHCGAPRDAEDRYCQYCKAKLAPVAEFRQEVHVHYHHDQYTVPQVHVEPNAAPMEKRSTHSRLLALVLCFFLGMWGAHKFYLGKFGMGFLYLFTFGFFSIGWMIDMVILLFGNPKDKNGDRLTWH